MATIATPRTTQPLLPLSSNSRVGPHAGYGGTLPPTARTRLIPELESTYYSRIIPADAMLCVPNQDLCLDESQDPEQDSNIAAMRFLKRTRWWIHSQYEELCRIKTIMVWRMCLVHEDAGEMLRESKVKVQGAWAAIRNMVLSEQFLEKILIVSVSICGLVILLAGLAVLLMGLLRDF